MTTAASHPEVPLRDLRAQFDGRLITPEDARYDEARTVFYGGFDRRPIAIVRATDAGDVARVVAFARERGLELAVRSGGHSLAGHSVAEGGIVLDLRDMKRLDLDVDGRTAWAEPGLTAAEYTAVTYAHGLATGFGDTGSVGIGGITVSGGVGYLVRKYGLTIDDLLAAEVVTADGEVLHTDAESHRDLFWALRGGGGNFGVVTRFRFRLHPVDRVVGGMLILPASTDVLTRFMTLADEAPEELSVIAAVMHPPPIPFLPAEAHGRLIVMAQLAYAGSIDAGERVITGFRDLATPIADMIQPMPYPELYPPEDDEYHPTAVSHTMFLESFDEQDAETVLAFLNRSDAPMRVAQLRTLGGAMARVPADATAFAHRDSRIMANVASFYETPEERDTRAAWVSDFATALRQSDEGAYVGFLADEAQDRVRQAYPGTTWDRLTAIKARYDPTNLFRLNQNIPPATA